MPARRIYPDPIRIGVVWHEPPLLIIGKLGLSEGTIAEAKRLLNKHKYMKIRLLRSSLEDRSKEETVHELCSKIHAGLAGIRGNTAVIYKIRARE
ncbi:MAG: YhbY family RNA-binding protein [Candidatus Thorarchaeota archaeon]